jgi:hypothetical protein
MNSEYTTRILKKNICLLGDRYVVLSKIYIKVKVTLRLTVSQSVRLGVETHLGPMARYEYL